MRSPFPPGSSCRSRQLSSPDFSRPRPPRPSSSVHSRTLPTAHPPPPLCPRAQRVLPSEQQRALTASPAPARQPPTMLTKTQTEAPREQLRSRTGPRLVLGAGWAQACTKGSGATPCVSTWPGVPQRQLLGPEGGWSFLKYLNNFDQITFYMSLSISPCLVCHLETK